jgi:rhamnosyltransferase
MQVSGVVILYFPDEQEIISNIQSYLDYVEMLIVFDNSNCRDEIIARIKAISPKIIFISNARNEGIARPLNKALELVADKSSWLLTMDQDSYFEPIHASSYFNSFSQLFFSSESVAVVCPNHSSPYESSKINGEYKEVGRAITSGSIINVKICRKVNGFDERLFIDDVDLEYCYRCIVAGYKIIQFDNIYLSHTLGTQKRAGYFWMLRKSVRSLHSPLRVYYMVRNFLYVSARYKKYLPLEIKQRKKELFVILKNNLLFSGKFFRVFVAIIKGYLHFKLRKFSSY